MTSPTVHVFVSSTWLDLQPERKAVESALQRIRETKFVGMEYFGARNESTHFTSLDEVDRSHLYVGIFGDRYGSGITEIEYRRARELGLPCFVYFKKESAGTSELNESDPERVSQLRLLKTELRQHHTVVEVLSPEDLSTRVTADLHRWLVDEYLQPKLTLALSNNEFHEDAQLLLSSFKDLTDLNSDLQRSLIENGYRIPTTMVAGSIVITSGDYGTAVASHHGDIIQGNKIINEARAVAAIHQLPRPPDDFTGRTSEFADVVKALAQGGAAITGLHGMGGIGKTALALKVAEHLSPLFPDAQFYLDLKGVDKNPLSVSDAMAHVIRSYERNTSLPESESELASIYRSVLHNKRALLLMDNAANRSQVEPLIPPVGCALLITSRQHFVLPGIVTNNLDKLDGEEACALLLKIAPRIGEHAETLANLCGYLPLALVLAGSALAECIDIPITDYARRLTDAQERLKLIDASLSLSYELLTDEMQALWRAFAVFPESFEASSAAAVWDIAAEDAKRVLGTLLKYSLVEWNQPTARYRFHDLARLFADNRLGEHERQVLRRSHAKHYLGILQEAESFYNNGGASLHRGLDLFDAEWGNIQAGEAYSRLAAATDNDMMSLCSSYCDAGVALLSLRQHPTERIDWLKAALEAAQRLQLREVEGRHLGNLGRAYRTIGQKRCDPTYFEAALKIAQEVGNRYDEGQALGNLGVLYRECKQTEQAVTVLVQRLAIARELLDRKGEGNALGNLGVAEMQLGSYSQALDRFNEQLLIASEIGDRRMQGQALGNIGVAHRKSGDIKAAIAVHEQSLSIHTEIKNHRGEGGALGDLGRDYMVLGDPKRAIEYYEQSLAVQRKAGYIVAEGHAQWNLSLAHKKLGKLTEAIDYARAALVIFDQVEDAQGVYVRRKIDEWLNDSPLGGSTPS